MGFQQHLPEPPLDALIAKVCGPYINHLPLA